MSDIKDFKLLNRIIHRVPHSDRYLGVQTVKCPECGNVFTQQISGGFSENVFPFDCPKCKYPSNVIFKNLNKEKIDN